MSDSVLSASGIWKEFEYSIVPSGLLQDRVLRWRKHRMRRRLTALSDVSINLKRGEWVGIYGPNGSGKTTLLRILAGLLPQDRGTVSSEAAVSCILGLGAGFHAELTAVENLYLHGLLHGHSSGEAKGRLRACLEFAELEKHADLPIKCFSSGMHARLAFAAATSIDADVFLLDEALAVADAAFKDKCEAHFDDLRKQGKSAIVVSHGLGQLQNHCDRVVYMEAGKVIRESRAEEESAIASAR